MSQRLSKTIFSVASIILLSRLLGFVREMVIANIFGTSVGYDIYLIAVMLPALAYGVINFASVYFFVPFLAQQQNDSDNVDWKSIFPPFNLILVSSIVLMLIIIVGAPYIMKIWGGHLSDTEFSQVVLFARLASVMLFLGTTEAFMRAFLNVKKIFSFPAGGFIVYNIFCIASIYLLYESFSVAALLIGLIAGLFFQNIFLLIKILRYNPFQSYTIKIFTPQSQALLKTAGIVVIIELINRSYFLLDRFIAPDFGDGIISALNYSQVIVQLPDSIIGFAIGAVVFPIFSESTGAEQLIRFQDVYKKALTFAVLIAVPIAVFFFLHAQELVYLLFHRGVFNLHSVELTATTLKPFVISIVSLFVISTSMRAGYSGGWGRAILIFVLISFALKFLLNMLLTNYFGYMGITMATSSAHLFFAISMVIFVSKKINLVEKSVFYLKIFLILLSGIVSGFVLYYLKPFWTVTIIQSNYFQLAISLLISLLVLVVIYILSLYIFNQKDLLLQLLNQRKKNG